MVQPTATMARHPEEASKNNRGRCATSLCVCLLPRPHMHILVACQPAEEELPHQRDH
jgi:hypothetical protein